MSRVYFLQDANGERRISESAFPLRIGGSGQGDVVVPDAKESDVLALLALSDGYAYIQPVDDAPPLFLNHELLSTSTWLKSGDQLQAGDSLLTWVVKGDQVFIRVTGDDRPIIPVPPAEPPPQKAPSSNLPVIPIEPVARGGRTLRRALTGLFAILIMILGLLLLAVPVEVRIDPPPESFQLRGFTPAVFFGQRKLVLPGRYRIQASLEGYHALDERLDISRQGPREFSFRLEELPGRVQLKPEPEAVLSLWVNDRPINLTSEGVAQIERGSHDLRVETERYLPVEMQVDVQGLGQSQVISFELQPAWALVSLNSQPAGAQVRVDSEVVGNTPLQTEILQGAHQLELKLDGYKPALLQRDFRAGENLQLEEFVLQADDGELMLRSNPEGATIIIDEQYHGTTPVSVQLTSGVEHRVRLSHTGYVEVVEKLTLEAGEQRQLEMKLAPQYGTVFLSTVPADARIILDGKPVDSGPRLRLTTRTHRLEVSKPGYVTSKLDVTPEAGASKTLQVVLTPAGEKPLSGKTVPPAALPLTRTAASGQQLRLVQATEIFSMGASRREAGRRANESRRKVQLRRPFYLSTTEVTNQAFRRFRPQHNSGRMEGVDLNGDSQPAVNVSWEDAVRYCNWLSQQDGLPSAYVDNGGQMQLVRPVTTGYRLPTEAEWAYVARRLNRQSESRYPWNGSFPPTDVVGNYADERIADTLADVVPSYNDGYRGTAPAGSFREWPNGFYDLGGNVAEWVNDYYTVYPGGAERLVHDPLGPHAGEHHVVRGAGWRHGNITELRLSYRDYSRKPRYDLGFRLARYAY